MTQHPTTLPMSETAGCGCGCGTNTVPASTGHTASTADIANPQRSGTSIATYAVTGMTCGHCVAAVAEELKALPGVGQVEVDLVAGGTSTVTIASQGPLSDQQVRAALDEAGNYALARS